MLSQISESVKLSEMEESDLHFKNAREVSRNVFGSRELNHLDGKKIAKQINQSLTHNWDTRPRLGSYF